MGQGRQTGAVKDRVAWVDYAKGFCIIMVVMMHSTIGTGHAMGGTGFLHTLVIFAKPFRMPDFYFYAGTIFSDRVFALAAWVGARKKPATLGLIAWAVVETLATFVPAPPPIRTSLPCRS
jgi:uncharacterized membrane protein YcfT